MASFKFCFFKVQDLGNFELLPMVPIYDTFLLSTTTYVFVEKGENWFLNRYSYDITRHATIIFYSLLQKEDLGLKKGWNPEI